MVIISTPLGGYSVPDSPDSRLMEVYKRMLSCQFSSEKRVERPALLDPAINSNLIHSRMGKRAREIKIRQI